MIPAVTSPVPASARSTRVGVRSTRPFAALAAGTLIALAAAVPAQAAEAAPATKRGLFLTLSGDGNTWIRGVLLECEPEPSGHHPAAAEACEEIFEADGDFEALRAAPRVCTKEFEPVTATATGTFRGRNVSWHKTYPNACAMENETGHVFRF
ncbi:SSI family serine proteinase inhibitor [Streptomyces sp. NPDC005562]|uniref:SSI family serine proteinase inhibitor n=1 Tax=Streptomyces sp. NPDC005562 TaxID=3154890 RepID=UPI0033A6B1AC